MKQIVALLVGLIVGGFAGYQYLPNVLGGGAKAGSSGKTVTEFEGVALDTLNETQKADAVAIFNEQPCVGCPGGYTMAECLAEKPANPTYVALANLAVRNLKAGRNKEQSAGALKAALDRATQPRPTAQADDEDKIYEVDIAGAPTKGPASAPVTIVEFSDFQCPFCTRGNNTVQQVLQEYGDKVKVVFKHFPLPFHKQAEPASRAAIAAGKQGKFWEMHDKAFANQRALTDDDLKKYAQELGLDVAKWEKDFNDPAAAKQVQADIDQGRKLGVSGTPTFFVNGKKLRGAKPFGDFKAAIDEVLAKSKG